jgi:hypothetical protein
MANSDVVRRMLQIIDDHEDGRITSSDVEREIENHMQALEKVDLRKIHESRDLTHRLVTAWFCDGDEQFGAEADAASVREEMRKFLRSLPDGNVTNKACEREPPMTRDLKA